MNRINKINTSAFDKITVGILLLLLGATIYYLALLYFQSVYYFNRTPWDGTFQTLFPLRKISNGEYPGIDFFYFHGNGIPYILYPIYFMIKTSGLGEIAAALHSTFIMNTLALLVPIYLLVKDYYPKLISILSVIIILVLFDYIPFVGAYLSPLFLGAPMGIRFLPHMIMAICVGRFLKLYECKLYSAPKKSYILPVLTLAFWGAIGVFCGAEQGVYSVVATSVGLFIYFLIRKKLLTSLAIPAILMISFFVILTVLSLLFFRSLDSIRAIATISNDQIWVFGVFPNSFFMSIGEIFSLDNMSSLPSQIATLIAAFFCLILSMLCRRKVITRPLFISLLVMFLAGVLSWVSNVGYIGAHQTALLIRFVLLTFVVIGFSMLVRFKFYADS